MKFETSSVQEAGSSGDFYLNVYQTGSTLSTAEIQFAIAYGNKLGSGSALYNSLVTDQSPTKTIYGQYQSLVIGDENTNFVFGGVASDDFYAISIDRNRYKEKILPGSLSLALSGSLRAINLTDDSQVVTTISYNDAGRVFNLVSGSLGVVTTTTASGYSTSNGSYGWLLPDIGVLILNATALSASIGLVPSASYNNDGLNNRLLYKALSGSNAKNFTLNNQETISSDYAFIRARNSEFNYSENPSFISGSTGEVIFNSFINNPQTYITTVGLYNDNNELLAVAKMSRPLIKDFTKEALIRIKLDF